MPSAHSLRTAQSPSPAPSDLRPYRLSVHGERVPSDGLPGDEEISSGGDEAAIARFVSEFITRGSALVSSRAAETPARSTTRPPVETSTVSTQTSALDSLPVIPAGHAPGVDAAGWEAIASVYGLGDTQAAIQIL